MASEKFSAKEVADALTQNKGMVYASARVLGCSPTTIYNYINRYKSVRDAKDMQRGLFIDTAELALWKAVQNGEAWAVSLALKTLGKDRGYVERVQQEVSGKDGGAIETQGTVTVDLSGLSTEQLTTLAASLED